LQKTEQGRSSRKDIEGQKPDELAVFLPREEIPCWWTTRICSVVSTKKVCPQKTEGKTSNLFTKRLSFLLPVLLSLYHLAKYFQIEMVHDCQSLISKYIKISTKT
jgi:hypothetical protein